MVLKKLLKNVIMLVLESEWLLVTIKPQPLPSLNKQEFYLKIGKKLNKTTQLCKENNSENLLVDSSTKEKKNKELGICKILSLSLEIYVSWLDHHPMTNI